MLSKCGAPEQKRHSISIDVDLNFIINKYNAFLGVNDLYQELNRTLPE